MNQMLRLRAQERPAEMESLSFSPEQKKAFRAAYAANATDEQFALFISECERRALVPGTHVTFSIKNEREFESTLGAYVPVKKVVMVTKIQALRLIADRAEKYTGRLPFSYIYKTDVQDADGFVKFHTSSIPLGRVPHAVSVDMTRSDWKQPLNTVCRFEAYVQRYQKDGEDVLTKYWQEKPEEALANCAEASGLRTIAPEECGGLYLKEEIERDSREAETVPEPVAKTVSTGTIAQPRLVPEPALAPPRVNQAPATPDAPARATIEQELAPKSAPPVSMFTQVEEPAPTPTPAPTPEQTPAPATTPAPIQTSPFREVAEASAKNWQGAFVVPEEPKPLVVAGPAATADAPATKAEYEAFTNIRSAKIVKDVLGKSGVKDGGFLLREWLMRKSGKPTLTKISKAKWEELLGILEGETDPAKIVIILKENSKK